MVKQSSSITATWSQLGLNGSFALTISGRSQMAAFFMIWRGT